MRKYIYTILIITYILLLAYLFTPKGYVDDQGSIDLYFCQEYNCSNIITHLLNTYEAKCAFYDLDENIIPNLPNDTLIFEENYNNKYIPVKSKALMHHKFCVFDKQMVLTGSWNPTYRGTYLNDNLILVINSKEIAKAYLEEWDKINSGKDNLGRYKINLSGTKIDLCFSPQGNCEDLIIKEINQVKEEVKFLTFTFTSSNIANTILEQNVSVQGVIETSNRGRYTVDLPYVLDENPYTMHHKAFILDDNKVILGSYNPTKSANERNDENLLIIESSELNNQMKEEYNRVISFINHLKTTSRE